MFDGAAGDGRRAGVLFSRDGSSHVSLRPVFGRILARDVSFHSGRRVLEPSIITQAILHEHTVKRSVFATIRAETRAFIIITADPAVLLVALPCASYLQTLQHLTLQLSCASSTGARCSGTQPQRRRRDGTMTPLTIREFQES